MNRAWLAALLCLGCGCGKSAVVDKPSNGSQTGDQMTKNDTGGFDKGADLVPKDKLIAWLDSQKRNGEPRLIRVPLVLPHADGFFDTSKARLGAAEGALEVYANDAALGVGLADRAQQKCGDKPCAFLVEGYWRGEQAGSYELEINKAEPLPEDKLGSATFAEVQGDAGN